MVLPGVRDKGILDGGEVLHVVAEDELGGGVGVAHQALARQHGHGAAHFVEPHQLAVHGVEQVRVLDGHEPDLQSGDDEKRCPWISRHALGLGLGVGGR